MPQTETERIAGEMNLRIPQLMVLASAQRRAHIPDNARCYSSLNGLNVKLDTRNCAGAPARGVLRVYASEVEDEAAD